MYLELLQKSVLPLLGTGLVTLFGWWIRGEWKILGNPANGAFKTRMQKLRGPDGKGRDYSAGYQSFLRRFLLWVDKYFGTLPPPNESNIKVFKQIRMSLSVNAFERLIQLAVIYPILFIFIAWVFTSTGTLGTVTVLPPTDVAIRVFVILMLGISIYSLYRFDRSNGWRQFLWPAVAVTFAGAGAGAGAVTFAGAGAGAGAVAVAVAVGVAVTVAIAVAGAGAGAGAIGVAVAFAVAIGVAVGVAFAVGVAVAVAGAGAVAVVVAVAVAFAVAGALIYATTIFYERAVHAGYRARFYVAFYIFTAVYFSLSVWLIASYGESSIEGFTILLFLGILPLLNAPLDWLSFGITRGLLRSIASGGHRAGVSLLWAAADVVLALVFLLLVALTTWTGIWLLNQVAVWTGGSTILDMGSLLQQLRTGDWTENLWIWLMLGSTLIPTAIHFLIASMAGFLALNRATAVAAAAKMQDALAKVAAQGGEADKEAAVGVDTDAQRKAFFYLYIAPALVIALWVAMTGIVSFIFLHWVPDLVQWFLSLINLAPELPAERKMFWMA